MDDKAIEEFKKKYQNKLETSLRGTNQIDKVPITTRDYDSFKSEYLPKHLSLYEKACNFSQKILGIKADKKTIQSVVVKTKQGNKINQ